MVKLIIIFRYTLSIFRYKLLHNNPSKNTLPSHLISSFLFYIFFTEIPSIHETKIPLEDLRFGSAEYNHLLMEDKENGCSKVCEGGSILFTNSNDPINSFIRDANIYTSSAWFFVVHSSIILHKIKCQPYLHE